MSKKFKVGDVVRVSAEKNDQWAGADMVVTEIEESTEFAGERGYIAATHPTLGLGGFYGFKHFTKVRTTKAAPGSYATGKGTTQRILNFLQGRSVGRTSEAIGKALKVPGRQLNKRLAEQVKKGIIRRNGERYQLVGPSPLNEHHPDFPYGCYS